MVSLLNRVGPSRRLGIKAHLCNCFILPDRILKAELTFARFAFYSFHFGTIRHDRFRIRFMATTLHECKFWKHLFVTLS